MHKVPYIKRDRQTDRQTDRRTDEQIDGQAQPNIPSFSRGIIKRFAPDLQSQECPLHAHSLHKLSVVDNFIVIMHVYEIVIDNSQN